MQPVRGSSLPGTPILAGQISGLQLVVEAAFGCPVGTDPAAWPWTDLTNDVQVANGGKINIQLGRTDEASLTQPAACTLVLDNRSGAYSKGPQSSHYPYIRRDTPIRVRMILNGVSYTRFMGRAVGWKPGWDSTGNYAIATLVAGGVLRRLNQGINPLQSTMRRSIPTVANLVAYWPCEDGSTSTSLASVSNAQPMSINGSPSLASNSSFLCSNALPTMQTDIWYGAVPSYPSTGSGQVRFLMLIPSVAAVPNGSRIVSIATQGTITRIDLQYQTNGVLELFAYSGPTQVFNVGPFSYAINDQMARMTIQWEPSGSDTIIGFGNYSVNAPVGVFTSATATGQSVTAVSAVTMSPDGTMTGATFGHVYVQNTWDSLFALINQINAFTGDTATGRLARLCSEQGEVINITGSSLTQMGAQVPDTFINLLRACEYADVGILYDGLNSGLTYTWREGLENQVASITLNCATGDVAPPLEPVDDDQLTMNQFTATRLNGGTYTFADTTDALSVAMISDYDDSETVNVRYDGQLPDFASWQVHLRTLDDYRWPQLQMWLHAKPYLIQQWLNTVPGNRMDVVNIQAVRKQQDVKEISLLLEGYTEAIDQFTWTVAANASSYDLWHVAEYAADTGDTNPWVGRYESDGSSTVGDSPAGSVSITVATPSGPLWTTLADDFPFAANMGGYQVTVTNITGSASPQTFTVNATASDIPPGAAVSIWLPNVLAMT